MAFRPRRAVMRESQIESYLVQRVKAAGGEIRKAQWIGHNGAPDRFVMLDGGRSFWVELKAPGKKPESHQAREHDRMRAKGQLVFVVDSIPGVDSLLGAMKC